MRSENGSLTLGFGLGFTVLALCAMAVVEIADRSSDRSTAKSGAEAAALAGSKAGVRGAQRAAAANGGVLIDHQGSRGDFTATVAYDGVLQTARARGDGPN